MTTTTLEQGAAFWQDMSIKTKIQPYSIMFQVEDNCPVYFEDYKDWIDYFEAAFPAKTVTAFIVEGEISLGNQRLSLHLYNFWSSCKEFIENHGVATA